MKQIYRADKRGNLTEILKGMKAPKLLLLMSNAKQFEEHVQELEKQFPGVPSIGCIGGSYGGQEVVAENGVAVVGGDDAPAADASGVVPVVAFGTDGKVIILAAISGTQETTATVIADKGQIIQTVLTVEPSVELGKLSFGSTAVGTGTGFGHSKIPPKCKISLRESPGGLHLYITYLEFPVKTEM